MVANSQTSFSPSRPEPSGHPSRFAWLWFVALPAGVSLAFLFLLDQRQDYLGHFLAGFGATLLVMWGIAVLANGAPSAVGIGTLLCLFIGLQAEATIFALGGFDSLDLCSQSLGGALAGLGILQTGIGDAILDPPEDMSLPLRNRRALMILCAAFLSLVLGTGAAFA